MKDCAVQVTIAGKPYGLYYDFDAYLALEQVHGLRLGPLVQALTQHSAAAARATLFEGVAGYARTFPERKQADVSLEEAGGLVFAHGLIETCNDIARALRATYRREKGLQEEPAGEGKDEAPAPTS